MASESPSTDTSTAGSPRCRANLDGSLLGDLEMSVPYGCTELL